MGRIAPVHRSGDLDLRGREPLTTAGGSPPITEPSPRAPSRRGRLLQVLGVAFGLAVIIGNTIGVGILRTPGEVAARLPSVPLFLGVWALGGVYALLGANSLSELGAMIPRSGGQFVFVRRALGRFPGFLVGWSDWISTCGTTAAVSIVLGEYVGPLIPALQGRSALVAATVVLAFALLQWRGIRVGDAAQQLTSMLKTLALLGLVGAILFLPLDRVPAAAGGLPTGMPLLAAFVIAFQSVIYTYDGWTGAIYFGEEMKDPGRSIPRATIGGVLIVMALYLMLNVAFLRAVPIGKMAGDPFVAATAATAAFGMRGDVVIRVLMVVSLLAAVNANQLIASRVPLAMGRDRLLPTAATRVNEGGTPTVALLCGTGIALLLIATNTFETILATLAFFFVASYAFSFASVFVLRRREPETPRPFRAIGYPWTTGIALAGSLAFLGASIVGDPENSLRSLLLLAASVPVFLWIRGRGPDAPG